MKLALTATILALTIMSSLVIIQANAGLTEQHDREQAILNLVQLMEQEEVSKENAMIENRMASIEISITYCCFRRIVCCPKDILAKMESVDREQAILNHVQLMGQNKDEIVENKMASIEISTTYCCFRRIACCPKDILAKMESLTVDREQAILNHVQLMGQDKDEIVENKMASIEISITYCCFRRIACCPKEILAKMESVMHRRPLG